jgi:hypothetical protein
LRSFEKKTEANLKEMKAGQEHLKEEIMSDLKTQIGWLTSCTDVSQEKVEACLEKAKASLEEMEAAVDVFEEGLDKMDTMDLKANQENSGGHSGASGSPYWRGHSGNYWSTGGPIYV